MKIQLDTDDMMHIAELLREDVLCSEAVLEEEPENLEAVISMRASKEILLKIAACAILKKYSVAKPSDDPIYIQSRTGLN